MYALEPLKAIESVNFPSDRGYTHNALIEELALAERHCRDESYPLCSCLSEKHTFLIAGLASEGMGFAESAEEREFMKNLMVQARVIRADIKKGKIKTDEDYDVVRAWAREMRHRLDQGNWSGGYQKYEYGGEPPELPMVIEQVHALSGGLMEIEERHVDEIITHLSEKWGIPKPPVRFVDKCNPLTDAWQVGRDLVMKDEDGNTTRVALPQFDELVFCRGSASPYTVAHEWCHFRDRYLKGSTDEESATKCGLNEVGNTLHEIEHKLTVAPGRESLNTLSLKRNSGGKMAQEETIMDYVPLVAGVFAGELIDEMGYIEQFTSGIAPGFEGIIKAGLGAGIIYFGYTRAKAAAKDFLIGMGAPLVIAGIKQQIPGLRPALRPPVVAAPTRLTPYARPTGLYRGHPTLQVPMIPPRPGVLYPPQMTSYGGMQEPALSGKWMLGGPSR